MSSNLIEKGIEACRNGAFEKGVVNFNKVLENDPQNVEALYNRARALSKIGDLLSSLADFKKLTEINPLNPSFIGDYAVSLHLNNRNDEASIAFERALQLEPTNPYRFSSRAFFKDRIGDLEGSIEDYEKALALDPNDAITLNNKGLVEEKLGYKDKAKSSFDKSNELVGYSPEAQSSSIENKQNDKSVSEASDDQSALTRGKVIRSVFTKEGFKDFRKFSIELLKGKQKNS